ncbi:multidrug effflux MFS transporter [Caviibacterium pharyngocola]|uniref:Bcr/CflA family efflux transporter n=1 Tax=Caviibacterium pharyngocola TaxID=28159 RepID=A0A2M8RYT4_9PAST|nr:multidrug effflux MFS transporter [Caviibacterium pharyngocola]PJG84034.1 Bcr/CflA family drug resistance efflux transporter [Caviibacterium pharyngocola]
MESKTANGKVFLVLLLGVLSAFGPFVIDLYLPALPQLAEFFAVNTSMTQLSLTSAMVGLAVGQLFLGPLSDKFGRKKPLMLSLIVYTITTALLVFSPNMESFVILRGIQGVAAAGSVVISRAVATDLYRGREMTRFFGLLMTVNGIAPIVSPVLGSLLLEYMSWRGIFIFLTALGAVLFIICLRLKESLAAEKRLQTGVLAGFKVFGPIFRNKIFMQFVLMQSFSTAGMFAYIAASPFIFQSFYGLSAFLFSLCFAANGAALVIGSNIGGKLAPKLALKCGTFGALILACFVAFSLITQMNVWAVEAGFFLLLLFIGILLPTVSALAMDRERRYAGSASALLGFCPFFLGAVVSPLVGMGNIFYSTALAIFCAGAVLTVIYFLVRNELKD